MKQNNQIKLLTLEETIFEIQNGFSFKSSKFKTEGKPIIRGQNIKDGKIIEEGLIYFDENDYPSNLKSYIDAGDIVITRWGSIGKIAYHFGKERLYFNQNICKIIFNKEIVKGKYLYYLLISRQRQINQLISGAALPVFDIEKFKKIKLPIPSLEKQEEIIQLLDKFRELERELHLRKQQYKYYRDELLSFKQDNKIKWLTLEEIATDTYRGSPITKNQLSNSGTPCIKYGEIYTTHKIWFDKCISYLGTNNLKKYRYCECGDLLIPSVGETEEDIGTCVAYLGKEKLIIDSNTLVFKHKQNPKFLSYLLSTSYSRKQKSKLAHKNSLVYIKIEKLKKIKIPLPPLEKQQAIVKLLDKFWSLSNDIKDGLPAEILLRKQQCEYYSSKLLN